MKKTDEKKKVLHIVEAFGAGVFSFLVDLIKYTKEDFDITVAYGIRKETAENFEEYFSDNVRLIKVENFTREINPKKDFKAVTEIKKIIKELNPDIIHLHSSKAGIIGRLSANGRKTKMLYNPHGFSFLKKDDSRLKRFIYKSIEKIATINKCTIVGCSEGEYAEALSLSNNAININNGIDIEDINTMNLMPKTEDKSKPVICTLARISYSKNPEIFNDISKEFSDLKFIWIGDGELRERLTSENIEITGWKEKEEALEILNNCDIFILPSLWEGLPISLLEAMYLKKLCIVSNVIGNKDVIQNNRNGFVCNSLEEYINTINKVLEQKVDLEGIKNNAYEDILNEYNTKKMAEEYIEEYKK